MRRIKLLIYRRKGIERAWSVEEEVLGIDGESTNPSRKRIEAGIAENPPVLIVVVAALNFFHE
jgi:hypothetical protein